MSGTNAGSRQQNQRPYQKNSPVMGLNILEAAWEDATGHAKRMAELTMQNPGLVSSKSWSSNST
ncbi:hypothetical protein [Legionella taurinensis]|uniref:hypothetical protein n=1 Tax=Legionella taurinensis TaxID=70611 RepID=UPI0011C03569|nr:hypothetical protein [Legionella taurinensis]